LTETSNTIVTRAPEARHKLAQARSLGRGNRAEG